MPACISARFDCLVFRPVMSTVPRIMNAEMVSRIPTEIISSISVKPPWSRIANRGVVVVVTIGSSERIRLERRDGRTRHDAGAALRGHAHRGGHRDAFEAP